MNSRSSLRNSNSFPDPLPRGGTPGRGRIAALSILVCLSQSAYALDPDRAMSQYVHDRWGAERGFPKGPVYAITQTADGYLWIGTEAGLVRFDGWSFRLIKDDSGAFTITSVLGLSSDEDGCLWLRLQDLSLLRYCEGKFDRPAAKADLYTRIEATSQANRGKLLMWKAEDGAYGFHAGKFEKIASSTDLPPSPAISLAQSPDGDVWIGTRDAGLFHEAGGKTVSIRNGLPDLKVNCLLPDGEGGVWVGTDDGIVRWNGNELTAGTNIPPPIRHFQALVMVRDQDGNIWVGTDSRGLLRLNSNGPAAVGTDDGNSRQAVTALFEDREGDLWVGHADGIERLRDSSFITYSTAEGLPTDGNNPVFVDSRNRMWFPPVAGGLWWARGEQRVRVRQEGLDRDVVYSIDGRAEELWVGRQRGGLTQLRVNGDSITGKTYTQADGLAQNSVYSVYLAHDGTVWAGTLSAGASMLRDGRFTNFNIGNGLASNTVAAILEDTGGTVWFATPTGLSAFSQNRWTSYGAADGLPSGNINCLFEDHEGVLWVGTASGLAFRQGGKFRVSPGEPAALRGQILGLAEDRYGSLWLATSSHVLRVKRDKLLQGLSEGDTREFGIADGLRGLEGVKRQRSVVADSSGRIWFSLNRGISMVDPARLTGDSAPAIPHIQTIAADGDPIPMSGSIRIRGGPQRITLGFSGLSLSNPERVRYQYRLDGYDRGWSEAVADREAGYTNLPPRHYRFRVLATNPGGVWSAQEASLDFEVEPLFWQTWWFRLAVVVACMAGVLGVYVFRLGQLTRQINLRFQERLAERTRIAQELHDTLLQGFLSVSMQVHVAADRLPEDSSVKPTLNRALELMRQVIDEGRNAVRGLRASHSVSLDLEQAFSRIQAELAATAPASEDVDFRVIVDGERRPLHPVLRDELYRIGREALLNAFRHSRAGKIEVELKYAPNRLNLLVRDDGCGIDPNVLQTGLDGHWGLSGMRERADRIGARLQVMSSTSAGTEIEVSIPGSVAFQDQPTGKFRWFGRRRRPGRAGDKPSGQNGKGK
jgi:signal transduction histidine kinase/ligand-binding sensor domain-containing protein